MSRLTRQRIVFVILALVFGCLLGAALRADGDDPNDSRFLIYYPGICLVLEPWTYWWGFWGCENRTDDLMSEDVTAFNADGRRHTVIVRRYRDGSVRELHRVTRVR